MDLFGPVGKAELTVQFALNDRLRAIQMQALVKRFKHEDIVLYITRFNEVARQTNLTVLPDDYIRDSFLALFLNRLKAHFPYFPPEMWGDWFENFLPLFLPGINETQISWLVIDISCTSYQSVVNGFNQAFVHMPQATKIYFYNMYIKRFLNKRAQDAAVCEFTSHLQWTSDNLGSFTSQATIQDLIGFNGNFSKVDKNTTLTPREMADFTVISDSLCDVTLTTMALNKVGYLKSYEELNLYLGYLKNNSRPNPYLISNISWCDERKVLGQLSVQTQQELILTLLSEEWILSDIQEWIFLFSTLLKDFALALNESHILKLPLNITCESYQAIIQLLNNVYPHLNKVTIQSVYDYCKSFLTEQNLSTGSSCTLNTTGTEEWITKNWGDFVSDVKISELLTLYSYLDVNVWFRLLTPEEFAVVLLKENILTDYALVTRILGLIETQNVNEYVTAITSKAAENNLIESQITLLKETLLAVILVNHSSSFSSFDTQDWVNLMNDLVLLLPYINETLLQFLPTDISCSSYQEIVKEFTYIYTSLSDITKQEFYNYFIKKFMTEKLSTGVTDVCETSDFRIWIYINFGYFIEQSTFADLILFNNNITRVQNPDELSSVELADYIFVADTIKDTQISQRLVDQIKKFQNYDTLLDYLNRIQSSLSQPRQPVRVRRDIGEQSYEPLNNTQPTSFQSGIADLSSNVYSRNQQGPLTKLSISILQKIVTNVLIDLNQEWSLLDMQKWIQVFDILITQLYSALTEMHFSQLPLNISCTDYQLIIKRLSNIYPILDDAEIKSVYTYIKSFLTQQKNNSGSACANDVNNTTEWISRNFGNFSTSASISDFMELYPDLDIGALLGLLNPDDVAKLLINPDNLLNRTFLIDILSLIQYEEISLYVTAITTAASKAHLAESEITMVEEIFLESVLLKINANFSEYKAEDWRNLFQQYLLLLLPSFNQTLLHLLPTDIPCSSYQEIVKGFSIAYESLSSQTKDDVFQNYIKKYLSGHSQSTGTACDASDYATWLELNIGMFFNQTSIQDLITFNENIATVENLALISAADLADITFLAESLQNTTLRDILVDQINKFEDCLAVLQYLLRIQSIICQDDVLEILTLSDVAILLAKPKVLKNATLLRSIFAILDAENITDYVKMITESAKKVNLSEIELTVVMINLLDISLLQLSSKFDFFVTKNWTNLFQTDLVLLLNYFNQTFLQRLPTEISCSSYQEIVKGFSLVFTSLSTKTKKDIFNYFIKNFLNKQKASTGSTCVSGTTNFEEWRTWNFGLFSEFATIYNFINFYTGFDAGDLPPNDAASILIQKDVLSNHALLESFLSGIEPANITEYVNAFTSAAIQANLSEVQITFVKQTLLNRTLVKLSSSFSIYETYNWTVLFQTDLVILLPYFNQTLLQLLPTDISCSSYQEIVKGFSLVFASLLDQTKEDIFTYFIQSYMTIQMFNKGSACISGTTNFDQWKTQNFGEFFIFATIFDFINFYPGFDAGDLSPNDAASILIQADFRSNQTLLTSFLSGIKSPDITKYIKSFTSAAKQANLSEVQITSVKETLLELTLVKLNSSFTTFETQNWTILFQTDLVILLPYFTPTLLKILPTDISCSSYQEIIKGFNAAFTSLSKQTKEDIFNIFIIGYLTEAKSSTGSACVSGSMSYEAWISLTFGDFYYLASIDVLTHFNAHFVPEDLPVNVTASLLVQEDVFTNQTLVTSILSGVQLTSITEFVNIFTSSAIQANLSEVQITSVKETLLELTLVKLNSSFTTFETQNWTILFQTDLVILLPYFTPTLLKILPTDISCSSYQEIIKGFNAVFTSLSKQTKEDIFNIFIIGYLTEAKSSTGSACVSGSMSYEAWISLTFGDFYYLASIDVLTHFNAHFVPEDLPVNVTASLLVQEDVFTNQTLVTSILSGVQLTSITEFVNIFTSSAIQANLSEVQITSVKETLLELTLVKLNSSFTTFETQNWTILFQTDLVILLPYFTPTLLKILPTDISCSSYQEIIKGFNAVFTSLSKQTKEDIFNIFIIGYLTEAKSSTGSACVSGSMSYEAWISLTFGDFYYLASIDVLTHFNAHFVPEDLPVNVTASLLVQEDVFTNQTLVTSILSGVQLTSITEFVNIFTSSAIQANLSEVQITSVKETLLELTLVKLNSSFTTFETQNWTILFQTDLVILLPYFTPTLLKILPTDISCSSYQEIIKGFNAVFTSLSKQTKEDIFNIFIIGYLTEAKSSTGSACVSGSMSYEAWISLTFGDFYYLASIDVLTHFNAHFVPEDLPVNVTASLLVQEDVFTNQTLVTSILSGVQLTSITEFVNIFTSSAIQANLSEVQITSVKETLLELTLVKLNSSFTTFETQNWTILFQTDLVILLPYFTPTLLKILPTDISCSSYQEIIKGFNAVFTSLSKQTKEDIFNIFIIGYLTEAKSSTGSACVSGSMSYEAWISLTFGDFYYLASIDVLTHFNAHFVPEDLPVNVTASLLVQEDVFTNQTLVTSILSGVQLTSITEFVNIFTSSAIQANLSEVQITSVKETLLELTLVKLNSSFTTFETQNWTILFQTDLVILLPYFTPTLLKILPTDISCSSYQEIIKGFNAVFTSLSKQTKEDIFNIFIIGYLTEAKSSTGSACVSGSMSYEAWISLTFGDFYYLASIDVLTHFNAHFVPEDLPVNVTASLLVQEDVFTNQTLVTSILSGVQLTSITEFVNIFTSSAIQANLSEVQITSVKETLLELTLVKLNSSFTTFETQNWTILFQTDLVILLPYFTPTLLKILPTDISCSSYQEIIKGFNAVFTSLSKQTKEDIFNIFIIGYLTEAKSSTGSACVSGSMSYEAWISLTFGDFYYLASIDVLTHFNAHFVPEDLPVNVTASLLVQEDVFTNQTLVTSILSGVQLTSITEFVNIFTSSAIQANLSEVQITSVKETLLELTLVKLNSSFTTFETQNWTILFQTDLVILLPYFTPTLLKILPTDISCSSYQEIIKGFNAAFTSLSKQTKEDIFNIYIIGYLTEAKSSTGSACVSGSMSYEEWISLTFGDFYYLASIDVLTQFNAHFVPEDLPVNVTANLLVQEDVFTNQTLVTSILSGVQLTSITEFVNIFTSSAIQANLSEVQITSVKETLLELTLVKLNSSFTTFETQNWTILFQTDLVILLPYFTPTLLKILPTDISCSSYQEIIKGFNAAFTSLSKQTKEDIFNIYIIGYLTEAKSSTGSACVSGSMSYEEWISLTFGDFYYLASIDVLTQFNAHFVPEDLPVNVTANLLVQEDVFTNQTLVTSILSGVQLTSITEFVNIFTSSAIQANLSEVQITSVKETLLELTLVKLNSSFTTFETQNWTILFQTDLVILLPYFTPTLLKILPTDISCSSYQEIVKGFSQSFTSLSPQTKEDIFNDLIKRYMTEHAFTDSVCASGTTNFYEWKIVNFHDFFIFATVYNFLDFYPGFDASDLSPNDAASILIQEDVLTNQTFLASFLSGIKPEQLTAYVNAFTSAASQANLSDIQIRLVKSTLLDINLLNLSSSFSTYNNQNWAVLFQTDLVLLLPYFNQTLLQLLPTDISCNSYQEIVKGFSQVFTFLSTQTKEDIFSYFIKTYMTEHASTGSTCVSGTTNFYEWKTQNFGEFFVFATIYNLVDFYPGFDAGDLSPNDAAAILIQEDALANQTFLASFLSGIQPESITEYVNAFTSAATKVNLSDVQITLVRSTLLEGTLVKLTSSFSTYETQNWTVLFQTDLVLLLPYFNQTLLQLLPMNISCTSYQEIVKGFNDVFTLLSNKTKDDIFNYFIISYLTNQNSSLGSACVSSTVSYEEWITVNFWAFYYFAFTYDYEKLYPGFVPIDLPPIVTANLLVQESVLTNHTLLMSILSGIQPENITDYVNAFTFVAGKANLSEIQITSVKENLLNTTLTKLSSSFSTYQAQNWTVLFQTDLVLLLPYFSPTLLQRLPTDISCDSYQEIMKGFSRVFTLLSTQTKKDIFNYYIEHYMTEHTSTDSTCVSGTTNFDEWKTLNFREFSVYATVYNYMNFYPGFSAGDLLPNDAASELTQENVLSNQTFLASFLSGIRPADITEYVNAFTSAATKASLSQTQITLVKGKLLDQTIVKLSSSFSTYQTQNWTVLFQTDLVLLLPYFNQTLLQLLPTDISCSSYQEILKGFSLVFTSLSNQTEATIFSDFIKRYMTEHTSTDSTCVSGTNNFEEWKTLNFREFSIFATIYNFVDFYPGFNAGDLTPNDAASVLTQEDVISNQTFLASFLSGIRPADITEYVNAFTSAATKASLSKTQIALVKGTLLDQTIVKLSSSFSTYQTQNWTVLFQTDLVLLLPYFNQTLLQLLPSDISCSSYQEILKGFSLVFTSLSNQTEETIFSDFIKRYMTEHTSTGSIFMECYTNDDGLQNFITNYFMNFSTLISADELLLLIPSSQLTQVLNTLSPQDLLHYLTDGMGANSTVWKIMLSHYTNITELARFMDILVDMKFSQDIAEAVFDAVWPTFLTYLPLSESELDIWLNKRFANYLPLITGAQLNVPGVMEANCSFYRNLVKTLSIYFNNYTTSTQQDIYGIFKLYLENSNQKPACYNSSSSVANSWIFLNLGNYLTYSSPQDLVSFTNNVELLKNFSVDSKTLDLIGTLTLPQSLKEYFSYLISAKNPSIPLSSIPQNILCYIVGNLSISTMSQSEALKIVDILKQCGSTANVTVGSNVVESIVTSVTTITADVLQTLGPLAVGLPPSVIVEKATGTSLLNNLQTLSQIETWSVTQASIIVTKITETNFKINVSSVASLGSLVVGLSPYAMDNLNNSDFITLAKTDSFTAQIERAPKALQQRFVQKVIKAAHTTTESIFQLVPPDLGSQIPVSNLSSSITIQQINQMHWSINQAQILFPTVMTLTNNYSSLTNNILQGFTCGAVGGLKDLQFQDLIKVMKGVSVSTGQLSCIAQRLTRIGAPADLANYPVDVLLFIGSSTYTNKTICVDYFKLIGGSNINLLPVTSPVRSSLLSNAMGCLNINNSKLTKENLQILGAVSCDLTDSAINAADSYILKELQVCSSFTDAQKAAINNKLIAVYGSPNTWTLSTLQNIGNLSSILSVNTLLQISTALKIKFFPGFLGQIKTQSVTSFSYVISQLKAAQTSSRDLPTCTNLTTDIIATQKEYLAVSYTSSELQTCLSTSVMNDNLDKLGAVSFNNDQLLVLKGKVDELFPNGIPEDFLPLLGNVATVYSAKNVEQWNITQLKILELLLTSASWESNNVTVNALVMQYLQKSNTSVDGTTLTIIAPYICYLNGTIIEGISREAITTSTASLNTATCSQSNKNLLFDKMKLAYQSFESSRAAYYLLLLPGIGGARTADLIQLSTDSPEMSISVFAGLNPTEVQNLNVSTIKSLLGPNLAELNTISSGPVMAAWIAAHTQSEVNSLGLSASAGLPDPTPSGFIVINMVTSGATNRHFASLLLSFAMAAIIHITTSL
ncbi:Hypothetical predicted protein [Pelobates cultripes]|uniref:Uncharacterized protein n=1 Tax=Pelobates cultripes TaxID=61616 RepID=A0AAD1SSJ4_PELCU|nr:Hypothetical predicted protein [Pelobates cultripes]